MSRARSTIEAQEQRFAGFIARGYTQSDALREIRPKAKGWTSETVHAEASKFANRATVIIRVREALRASRLSDLDSIPEWHADLQDKIAKAEADGAHSAVMTGMRQRAQAIGAIKQNIVLDASGLLDDSAIIDRLAAGDEHKAAMLKAIIGSDDFPSDVTETAD